jgi:hypothetical protein
MVLSSFYNELSATVPAPLHWADYVEPMQYSGLGVFRPPKLKPSIASTDFLPRSDETMDRSAFAESDDLTVRSEQPFLALVNGPDGWQWAKLPKTFDVMAALKAGQSLFHDQVSDDHQPGLEQVDDEIAEPQASVPQHDDSVHEIPADLHSRVNLMPSYAGTNQADIYVPSLHSKIQSQNALPTLPTRLCDAVPESRGHNYSYTDHFSNGDFASREVATRCVGGVCHSIAHDIFPEATGLMTNTGAAESGAWAPVSRKAAGSTSQAVRKAFLDLSQWLTNGIEENCGGQYRHRAPTRSFSHGYVFSSANGDARIAEQETHCRDGHCVKVVRHLVPRPSQYSELDTGNPSRPLEQPDLHADNGPPIYASNDEATAPLQPTERFPRVAISMI